MKNLQTISNLIINNILTKGDAISLPNSFNDIVCQKEKLYETNQEAIKNYTLKVSDNLIILDSAKDMNKWMKAHKVTPLSKLIHALCHIEYSAVMSYSDTLCRFNMNNMFSDKQKIEFFEDIFKVISDEVRHYSMLYNILENDLKTPYTSQVVNKNILADLEKTQQNFLERICMISMTHEAKGLDAGPRLIEKARTLTKNSHIIGALETIVKEEEMHVEFGVKWYEIICEQENFDKHTRYKDFMDDYAVFLKKDMINQPARERARFNIDWLKFSEK